MSTESEPAAVVAMMASHKDGGGDHLQATALEEPHKTENDYRKEPPNIRIEVEGEPPKRPVDESPDKVETAGGDEESEKPKLADKGKEIEKEEEEKPKLEGDEEKEKLGKTEEEETTVEKSASFKEESNFLSDLKDTERKALVELRAKVEEAILENRLLPPKKGEEPPAEGYRPRDISLWGVPLFPGAGSESTDVLLLKFLRARDFKPREAMEMLANTLQWRRDEGIDAILNEVGLREGLEGAAYMDTGRDHDGHPICYNVYGVFQDEDTYKKTFGTEEGVERFLRWRLQLMERGIREGLELSPGGAATILQVTDLRNAPGVSKKELRAAMRRAVTLLQDNYPEFVAKNVFINVPFWYYAFNAILSPFLTQRTKSKFVFARPSKVTETLLRYIPPGEIPLQYGGLRREEDPEFSPKDGGISELIVKAGTTENIYLPAPEAGMVLLWDLTVFGWEVSYKEEFVPDDEGSYTIIVQKERKMVVTDEAVRNSFRNNEPGKVVLTVENNTFKKKKVLYRYKTKETAS